MSNLPEGHENNQYAPLTHVLGELQDHMGSDARYETEEGFLSDFTSEDLTDSEKENGKSNIQDAEPKSLKDRGMISRLRPPQFVEDRDIPAISYKSWRERFHQFKIRSNISNWMAVSLLQNNDLLPSNLSSVIQSFTSITDVFQILDSHYAEIYSELTILKENILGTPMNYAGDSYDLRQRIERIKIIVYNLTLLIAHFPNEDLSREEVKNSMMSYQYKGNWEYQMLGDLKDVGVGIVRKQGKAAALYRCKLLKTLKRITNLASTGRYFERLSVQLKETPVNQINDSITKHIPPVCAICEARHQTYRCSRLQELRQGLITPPPNFCKIHCGIKYRKCTEGECHLIVTKKGRVLNMLCAGTHEKIHSLLCNSCLKRE